MLFVVRHTKIRSKLQILKRISDVRDTPHQGWQSRLPVATHTSVCIPRMLVTALRNLTIANYLAPLKDLELSRKAARANAADATSHASPTGWITTENKAFICTGSAVAQQDADAAYCAVAALSSWALECDGEVLAALQRRFAWLGAQISEETSYVIEQLQLQLMLADNSICYCYCLNSMQAVETL